ncbi:hypothetical protein H4582DRAFT_2059133 [Lactarius indigo]|nr:hypothetical protein H4582DRAFT_2059133 [Lactarius indigo]
MTKLTRGADILIATPDGGVLTFDQQYLGRGIPSGETELQDNAPGSASGGLLEFNQAQLETMGFPLISTTQSYCRAAVQRVRSKWECWLTALRETARALPDGIGPSVHSGHYVAHIRSEAGWVVFNNEKVVLTNPESVRALRALAHLFVFERDSIQVAC